MAVLVNDYTASSSEIFSGAMRDYGKAILVGEKTYGKGIVQQVFSLNDGSGVKLTIASYFLPAGDNIHKVGIEPDVQVELPTELRRKANLKHSEDTQLQRAIAELGGEPLPEDE
jgi:carboxyl-terminal processing protease